MKLKNMRATRILVAMLLILTMVAFGGCGNNDDLNDGVNDNNTPVTDTNDNGTNDGAGTDGTNNNGTLNNDNTNNNGMGNGISDGGITSNGGLSNGDTGVQ